MKPAIPAMKRAMKAAPGTRTAELAPLVEVLLDEAEAASFTDFALDFPEAAAPPSADADADPDAVDRAFVVVVVELAELVGVEECVVVLGDALAA